MNAPKITLLLSGFVLAFALGTGPNSKPVEQRDATASTPHSADHARIDAPAEELPAQF